MFKDIKKREKLKPFERKCQRLYACENLVEDDLGFLNDQFQLYKSRENGAALWGIGFGGLLYRIPLFVEFHWLTRGGMSCFVGYLVYKAILDKTKKHYRNLLIPYFEKYKIK